MYRGYAIRWEMIIVEEKHVHVGRRSAERRRDATSHDESKLRSSAYGAIKAVLLTQLDQLFVTKKEHTNDIGLSQPRVP